MINSEDGMPTVPADTPENEVAALTELLRRDYFDLTANRDKTAVLDEVAAITGQTRQWIKDVVANNYGKRARKITDDRLAEIVGMEIDQLDVERLNSDPLVVKITERASGKSLYGASAANIGVGISKLLEIPDFDAKSAFILANNGHHGPLSDDEFFLLKKQLSHLGLDVAAIYNGGVTHPITKAKWQLKNISDTNSLKFSNYEISILAKRFLIFTGLSGSGKSRVAKQIALTLSAVDSQYHFAAVGPDWNNRDPLLGYPDGIHPTVYQTTPVLELLIRADKPENQNKPFFLILDEMNLSHVERYFADFLSAMESGEKITLYEGGNRGATPPSIALPPNLFIIGTVNIDETTYQFSPKVLDRANVIEFKMDKGDVGKFFAGSSVVDDFGAMAGIAEEFVSDAKTNDQVAIDWAAEHPSFATEMEVLFKILQNFNGEFGFRTLKESSRYLYFHNKYSVIEDDNAKYQDAMDCIILQKLLPKLHGSRSKVEGILRALLHFCETTDRDLEKLEQASLAAAAKTDISLDQLGAEMIGHYKQSHHKLKRMCKKLHQDQFVSFADA